MTTVRYVLVQQAAVLLALTGDADRDLFDEISVFLRQELDLEEDKEAISRLLELEMAAELLPNLEKIHAHGLKRTDDAMALGRMLWLGQLVASDPDMKREACVEKFRALTEEEHRHAPSVHSHRSTLETAVERLYETEGALAASSALLQKLQPRYHRAFAVLEEVLRQEQLQQLAAVYAGGEKLRKRSVVQRIKHRLLRALNKEQPVPPEAPPASIPIPPVVHKEHSSEISPLIVEELRQQPNEEILGLIEDFLEAYRKTPGSLRNKKPNQANREMFGTYQKLYSYVRLRSRYRHTYQALYDSGQQKFRNFALLRDHLAALQEKTEN